MISQATRRKYIQQNKYKEINVCTHYHIPMSLCVCVSLSPGKHKIPRCSASDFKATTCFYSRESLCLDMPKERMQNIQLSSLMYLLVKIICKKRKEKPTWSFRIVFLLSVSIC